MKLSERILNVTGGGDDGWSVFYKARALKAAGEAILELTIGEHDQKTDPGILRAMEASMTGGNTGYAAVPGIPALRETIARRVRDRTGIDTAPGNILVTPGGQAALFAAHMAALDPGDTALYVDPHYATYPGTIRAVGAVGRMVAARPEHGFQPRRDDLDAAAAAGARSLLINSPNNPTGAVYSRATMETIADLAQERDLWLISDEVYDTQIWRGSHLSPRALPGMAERTMVVGSLSKSHAMTGSRIGWLVAPEQAIRHLIDLSTSTTYGVPGFVQDAALHALGRGAALERSVAAPFRRRREIARRLLGASNALRLTPPDGSMYLMLDIRATGLSGRDFALRLLEREKIAVMPGESFGRASAGHVRVAMTVADDLFADALIRLAEFAASLSE